MPCFAMRLSLRRFSTHSWFCTNSVFFCSTPSPCTTVMRVQAAVHTDSDQAGPTGAKKKTPTRWSLSRTEGACVHRSGDESTQRNATQRNATQRNATRLPASKCHRHVYDGSQLTHGSSRVSKSCRISSAIAWTGSPGALYVVALLQMRCTSATNAARLLYLLLRMLSCGNATRTCEHVNSAVPPPQRRSSHVALRNIRLKKTQDSSVASRHLDTPVRTGERGQYTASSPHRYPCQVHRGLDFGEVIRYAKHGAVLLRNFLRTRRSSAFTTTERRERERVSE
jgi:hypothetical protein